MAEFEEYVGIDYSGQGTANNRLEGIQVASARGNANAGPVLPTSGARNWSRREATVWIISKLLNGRRVIVGIDHAFSFPLSYLKRYQLHTWDSFLTHFNGTWDVDRATSTQTKAIATIGRVRQKTIDDWRLTERWTSSAQSVLETERPRSVAKASFAGVPWLRRIRSEAGGSAHFWPFDGFDIPLGKSVVAEVYPAIFVRRFSGLNQKSHLNDALAVCRWLQDRDAVGLLKRYFHPNVTPTERRIARIEGWILGIM